MDDKPVIICIRITKILLELSEWVDCLPSPGHRRMGSRHHEPFISKRNFCLLGNERSVMRTESWAFEGAIRLLTWPTWWSQSALDKWGPHLRKLIFAQNVSSESCWMFPQSHLALCQGMDSGLCAPADVWGTWLLSHPRLFLILQTHYRSLCSPTSWPSLPGRNRPLQLLEYWQAGNHVTGVWEWKACHRTTVIAASCQQLWHEFTKSDA